MQLPEFLAKRADKLLETYCRRRNGEESPYASRFFHLAESDGFILMEERDIESPRRRREVFPRARLRYQGELRQWTLHYYGTDSKWRFCLNVSPSLDLDKLLQYVTQDPLGLFGGQN